MAKQESKKVEVRRKALVMQAKKLEQGLNELHRQANVAIEDMGLTGLLDFEINNCDEEKEFSVRWVVDDDRVKIIK